MRAIIEREGRFPPKPDIGVKRRTFDFICLFSIFTHLAPADYQAMLELTRK